MTDYAARAALWRMSAVGRVAARRALALIILCGGVALWADDAAAESLGDAVGGAATWLAPVAGGALGAALGLLLPLGARRLLAALALAAAGVVGGAALDAVSSNAVSNRMAALLGQRPPVETPAIPTSPEGIRDDLLRAAPYLEPVADAYPDAFDAYVAIVRDASLAAEAQGLDRAAARALAFDQGIRAASARTLFAEDELTLGYLDARIQLLRAVQRRAPEFCADPAATQAAATQALREDAALGRAVFEHVIRISAVPIDGAPRVAAPDRFDRAIRADIAPAMRRALAERVGDPESATVDAFLAGRPPPEGKIAVYCLLGIELHQAIYDIADGALAAQLFRSLEQRNAAALDASE